MMLWEPSGCCCFSRRTGSLILGTIILVTSCLNILGLLKSFLSNDFSQIIKEVCDEGEKIDNCEEFIWKTVIGVSAGVFIVSLIQLTFSSLLLYGIMKSKTRLLIPFMIMYLIQIIIIIIMLLVIMGLFIIQSWQAFIIIALIGGAYVFVETYFLLVIRAYFLEVRRQKAQEHMILQEEGFTPAPTPQDKPIPYSVLYPNMDSQVPYNQYK